MKNIATDIYSFEQLISNRYLYVDKTAAIHRLVAQGIGQSFFLSRPRRFGKSLLVSILKALFQGRRELFQGLAIDSMDYDWKRYPVIHLDMGSSQASDAEELKGNLNFLLDRIARQEGLELAGSPQNRLTELIETLASKSETGKVVVLVDEYDKPLLGHLGGPDASDIWNVLKDFYSVLKTTSDRQRFAFITGLCKFTRASIFSGLNNLIDLTMAPQTATLLGYTHDEVRTYLGDHISAFASAQGLTPEEALEMLDGWFGGYRFHHAAATVFNPVSIGRCLSTGEISNDWFETGTPTFLVDFLKRTPMNLGDLTATEEEFSAYEPGSPALLPLLVQTGYLTILGAERLGETRLYRLGHPNKEVARSFSRCLVRKP